MWGDQPDIGHCEWTCAPFLAPRVHLLSLSSPRSYFLLGQGSLPLVAGQEKAVARQFIVLPCCLAHPNALILHAIFLAQNKDTRCLHPWEASGPIKKLYFFLLVSSTNSGYHEEINSNYLNHPFEADLSISCFAVWGVMKFKHFTTACTFSHVYLTKEKVLTSVTRLYLSAGCWTAVQQTSAETGRIDFCFSLKKRDMFTLF